MEKDDNTYYVLYARGYSQEFDTLQQALEYIPENLRDQDAYEIIKITEKLVGKRA